MLFKPTLPSNPDQSRRGRAARLTEALLADRNRKSPETQAVTCAGCGRGTVDRLDRQVLGCIPFATGDFLKRPPVPTVPAIVCNPPFSLIREFCEHALAIATHKVAMYMPLPRLPAAHWLELPLETIWVMTPRPSAPPGSYIAAGKKPKGHRKEYCWLIFRKGLVAWTPRLHWLHRDRETTTTTEVMP